MKFPFAFLCLKVHAYIFGLWIGQQTVSSFASSPTVRCWFCLDYRWKKKYKGIYQAQSDHRTSVPM